MKFNLVVGSWGSYNACNERALGSSWLDLSAFSSWEEVEKELKKEGFDLSGLDEELFVQDIDIDDPGIAWDFVHPKRVFDVLKNSGMLEDSADEELFEAFIEARGFTEFMILSEKYGEDWWGEMTFYKDFDWEDLGREVFEMSGYSLPDGLDWYFDFEKFGESLRFEGYKKVKNGIIYIL